MMRAEARIGAVPPPCQGDALALFYLGESYYNGRGVVQDFAEGIKWYKQSAEKGQVEAQETLGGLYFFGKGNAQLSGEEGERVGKVRDFIASKLSPDQLAKAQEMARKWKPKK